MNKNITKHLFSILIIIFILSALIMFNRNTSQENPIVSSDTSQSAEMPSTSSVSELDTVFSDNLTAEDIVSDITVGWNLGNSFDSCTNASNRNDGTYSPSFYETAWGNPVTTKKLIDLVADSGFNAIRIPVTWFYNTYEKDGHLHVREEWLERIAEVVQYALDNNMYVIINSHHDAPILWADMNDIKEVSCNAEDLWSQIAEYFKDYDNKLLFESYNELNTKNDSWTYSEGACQATNILNQVFVDTVRKTGGNNAERVLICGTYLNDYSEDILAAFTLPTDSAHNKLIIQTHSYCPYYNQDIDGLFILLNNFSKKHDTPIIIGEFGSTTNYVPIEYRSQHAGNYISRASQYNIKCFWWDNGLEYKIFDRTKYTISQKDIIYALMNPHTYNTNDISTYRFDTIKDFSYSILDSSNGTLSDFTQGALTLNINNLGHSVTSNHSYRLFLRTNNEGNGIRISHIAFYNSSQNMISCTNIKEQIYYDITAPDNAAYMRISLYNPWGYRSIQDYQRYLEEDKLYLEIVEYIRS